MFLGKSVRRWNVDYLKRRRKTADYAIARGACNGRIYAPYWTRLPNINSNRGRVWAVDVYGESGSDSEDRYRYDVFSDLAIRPAIPI